MAASVTVLGLLRTGQQLSQTAGYSAVRFLQCMSIDDSTVVFAQSHTTLATGGVVTNAFDQSFDATPTTSTDSTSATVSHITTYGTANGNFTVRRIALHDDTSTNVTTASATLHSGVDSQALAKTTDFSAAITLRLKYVLC